MSYEPTQQNFSADRVLRLIQESGDQDTLWVRTLNLKNDGVSVILDMEGCLKQFTRIVNPARQATLAGFYKAAQIAMISTSSVEGWIMSQLTETKIKQVSDVRETKAQPSLFGGK